MPSAASLPRRRRWDKLLRAATFLLEVGADPGARSSAGMPLLCVAAYATRQHEGGWALVELLLRHGADPDVTCERNGAPMHLASSFRPWNRPILPARAH